MISDKEIRKVLCDKKISAEISRELNISDRQWRKIVNEYNNNYEKQERLIVSDKDGYELTTNKKLIMAYAFKRIRHGLSELSNGKKILKLLSEKNQLKLKGLDKENTDLIDTVMKMEI